MESQDKLLGTASIPKLLLKMALPTMAAQIINMLYNVVDRIYIGRIPVVGDMALTGLGVAMPVILIVSAFAAFAGMGGAPLASIRLGEQNPAEAEKILGNSVALLLAFSVLLTTFFQIFKEPILWAFGASQNTIGYATDYLGWYLWGTLFVQLALGLNSFITAQGNARTAMLSVLIGAVLNIVLDPIFIFGFGMGVKGAALATVLSQAASAAWVVWYLLSKKSVIRIRLKNLRPKLRVLGAVAALGMAPFIMQATESLVLIVLNSGLKKYGGDVYVGSMTIMMSVLQLLVMPVNGIGQGAQPILSYNYGAKNYDRVRSCFKWLLTVNLVFTCCGFLAAFFFPGAFALLFTDKPELLAVTKKYLPLFLGGIWAFGAQMACQISFLSMGQAKISLFLACLRKLILLVPLALILPAAMNSPVGVYLAEPLADIIASATTLTLFIAMRKKLLPKAEPLADAGR